MNVEEILREIWRDSRLKSCANLVGGKEFILDLGCGDGHIQMFLKCKCYVGIDYDFEMLKQALNSWPQNDFIRADIKFLPFRNSSFDAILCCDVLEHILEPRRCLEECARILKKMGSLIVSVPNSRSLFGIAKFLIKGEVHWMSLESLPEWRSPHLYPFTYPVLKEILRRSHFIIIRQKPFFMYLPPRRLLMRVLGRHYINLGIQLAKLLKKYNDNLIVEARRFDSVAK